jgi:hypothetical protein
MQKNKHNRYINKIYKMNTQRKIFEKLSKTKVELGLVDELEYSLKDLQDFVSEQESVLNDFDGEISKITSIVSDLLRSIEFKVTDMNTFASGKADMNKLMDIASQLGVPVTDLYPPFDEYTALMQEADANSELLSEKAIMLENTGLL